MKLAAKATGDTLFFGAGLFRNSNSGIFVRIISQAMDENIDFISNTIAMKTSTKVLYWAPRVICILAILLISLFAFDSFSPDLTIWQQLGAFLIHLIPSFVLLALLIVAWKWELIGGIIFSLIGLGFSPFIYLHNYKMNHSVWMSIGIVMMITIPFLIAGILFIVSHYKKDVVQSD